MLKTTILFIFYSGALITYGQLFPKWSLQGWVYPGYSNIEPTCQAYNEINDGRFINVVKSEFLRVNGDGYLQEYDDGFYCNHNTSPNYNFLKSNVSFNIVTISGAFNKQTSSFKKLLEDTLKILHFVNYAVSFVEDYSFNGIEINFEQFKLWQSVHWNNFKYLISILGDSLHNHEKILIITGPPLENEADDNAVLWNYSQLRNLPIDYFTLMIYDYFYCDLNAPVAPFTWFKNVLEYCIMQIQDTNKIIVGINSYGYTTKELIDITNCNY